MKRYKIIKILLALLIVLTLGLLTISFSRPKERSISESEIWNSIENKTLYSKESFAGESYTFFEAKAGYFVIIQTYGSGVRLVESYIKRVDVKNDTVTIKGVDYRLENEELVSEDNVLKDKTEIYLINYDGKEVQLDLYLAVQSVLLDEISY